MLKVNWEESIKREGAELLRRRGLDDSPSVENLSIMDKDGQILFHHGSEQQIMDMAPLVAGIASAGEALGNQLHHQKPELFIQTNKGCLVILPLGESHLLITLFRQHPPMGRLKMELQFLRDHLDREAQKLESEGKTTPSTGDTLSKGVKTNQKMFENITDEEVDNLFQL